MTDQEREVMKLMYELQLEMHRAQGDQIEGLKQAVEGATKAIQSAERAQEILGKLLAATGRMMGVH